MHEVYVVHAKPMTLKRILRYLRERGFNCEESILSDYVFVFFENPEPELKKVFKGFTVSQINPEEEKYIDLVKSIQEFRYALGMYREGDAVRVIDESSPYYGTVGQVERIDEDRGMVEVTLLVWGAPVKVELPKDSLSRIEKIV